jgi:hypothetical protein
VHKCVLGILDGTKFVEGAETPGKVVPTRRLDDGNLLRAYDFSVMWHPGPDANRTDIHRAHFGVGTYHTDVSLI